MNDGDGRSSTPAPPPVLNQWLGLSWMVLFCGRWIGVPFLLAAGVLSPSMVSDLDDRFLLYCYTALLTASIMVLVLGAMRGGASRSAAPATQQTDTDGMSGDARPVAAQEADRRPKVGD